MTTNDGGPAFPVQGMALPNGEWLHPELGMSLRDWFAGQMLPEIYRQAVAEKWWQGGDNWRDEVAGACGLMADAMLRAREAGR